LERSDAGTIDRLRSAGRLMTCVTGRAASGAFVTGAVFSAETRFADALAVDFFTLPGLGADFTRVVVFFPLLETAFWAVFAFFAAPFVFTVDFAAGFDFFVEDFDFVLDFTAIIHILTLT
jgi:hypothetical protein